MTTTADVDAVIVTTTTEGRNNVPVPISTQPSRVAQTTRSNNNYNESINEEVDNGTKITTTSTMSGGGDTNNARR